ncbi:MAG: hypothetical protein HC804_11955 [Anaerolineae bacterium]|nr:hypothetical protein [Anaerolineae bacterium]
MGDNYFADGRGAEAAGMMPIIYDPEALYVHSAYPRIQHMSELLTLLATNGRT